MKINFCVNSFWVEQVCGDRTKICLDLKSSKIYEILNIIVFCLRFKLFMAQTTEGQ